MTKCRKYNKSKDLHILKSVVLKEETIMASSISTLKGEDIHD